LKCFQNLQNSFLSHPVFQPSPLSLFFFTFPRPKFPSAPARLHQPSPPPHFPSPSPTGRRGPLVRPSFFLLPCPTGTLESGRRPGAASPAPLARTSRGTPPLFKQGPAPPLEPYQVEAVALHAQTLAAIVEAPPELGVAAAPLFRRSPHEFEPARSFALRWGFS